MKRAAVLLLIAAAACTSKTAVVRPTPSFTTSLPPNADEWALRYRLLEQFKPLFFCDPDEHPVGVGEAEVERRAREWHARAKDSAELQAILRQNRLRQPLTDDQIFAAYEQHKRLQAVHMEPTNTGFGFSIRIRKENEPITFFEGTIRSDGYIRVRRQYTPDEPGFCPICLQGKTQIGTPEGAVPVERLRVGMLVWTRDGSGARVGARVLRVVKRRVASPHPMVRVRLRDGRALIASAAHPDAAGRPLGTLSAWDFLDGRRIAEARVIWVRDSFTYDLLPEGPTGDYLANGIWLGSTLSPRFGASRSSAASGF